MLKTNFDGKLDINVISKLSVKEFVSQNHLLNDSDWSKIINNQLEIVNDLKIAIIETDGVYGIKAKDALQKCKIFIGFCFVYRALQLGPFINDVTPKGKGEGYKNWLFVLILKA